MSGEILRAALSFAVVFSLFLLAQKFLLGKARLLALKTSTGLDDLVVELFEGIRLSEFAVLSLYFAARSVSLPPSFEKIMTVVVLILLTVRGVLMIQALLSYWIESFARRESGADPQTSAALRTIRQFLSGLLWIGAVLFLLDNLGVNITAAVAGLGIGGLAVAMAGQQILGDLFSSLVIFFDKPFSVGDEIKVDDFYGTVESIGIKTSRIRSLSGELIIVGNADLTKSRIRNFERLKERRAVLSFGVVYKTSSGQVRAIPEWVREIVSGIEDLRFERAHFKSLGPSSLDFEAVYYTTRPEYSIFMDRQQRVNLALMERFEREGVSFAYPTQTVIIEKAAQPAV